MAVNRSKLSEKRMWDKWSASGATERIEDSIARELAARNELRIGSITMHLKGPAKGHSLLGIGKRVLRQDLSFMTLDFHLNIIASGHDWKLDQNLRKLPTDYKTVSEIFGKTLRR